MNRTAVARQILLTAKELLGMDFPSQDALDKYLKDHPDANRSNHKVVQSKPGDMPTHPMNLMRQRKNDKRMEDIAKALKKKPSELTNDDIEKFNKSGR